MQALESYQLERLMGILKNLNLSKRDNQYIGGSCRVETELYPEAQNLKLVANSPCNHGALIAAHVLMAGGDRGLAAGANAGDHDVADEPRGFIQ